MFFRLENKCAFGRSRVTNLKPRNIATHKISDWPWRRPSSNCAQVTEDLRRPSVRHAVCDAGVLVAGEAETDEPLAVELSCHLFQERHSPPVVLDQAIVIGKDVYNALLNTSGRKMKRYSPDNVMVQRCHRRLISRLRKHPFLMC